MGAFDAQRAPERSIVEDCVHCGFCLDSCPTYVLWANEADSPRGRIVLIGEGLDSADELSNEMVTHFDRCLGCMACVTACPSGVRYDRLIERVRPQVERRHKRTSSEQALRLLLFETLPYPSRLRKLAPMLAAAHKIGAARLGGRLGTLAKLAPRNQGLSRFQSLRHLNLGKPRVHPGLTEFLEELAVFGGVDAGHVLILVPGFGLLQNGVEYFFSSLNEVPR